MSKCYEMVSIQRRSGRILLTTLDGSENFWVSEINLTNSGASLGEILKVTVKNDIPTKFKKTKSQYNITLEVLGPNVIVKGFSARILAHDNRLYFNSPIFGKMNSILAISPELEGKSKFVVIGYRKEEDRSDKMPFIWDAYIDKEREGATYVDVQKSLQNLKINHESSSSEDSDEPQNSYIDGIVVSKLVSHFDRSSYFVWAKQCYPGNHVILHTVSGWPLQISDWVRMEVNECERGRCFPSKPNLYTKEFKCTSFTKIEPLLKTVPTVNRASVMVTIPDFEKCGDTLYHPTLGYLIDDQKLLKEDGTYRITLTRTDPGKASNGKMTVWHITDSESDTEPDNVANSKGKEHEAKHTVDGIIVARSKRDGSYMVWTKQCYPGTNVKLYTGIDLKVSNWVRMNLTNAEFERYFPLVPTNDTPRFECRSFTKIDPLLMTMNYNDNVSVEIANFVKTDDRLHHHILGYLRDLDGFMKKNGTYDVTVANREARFTSSGDVSVWLVILAKKHRNEIATSTRHHISVEPLPSKGNTIDGIVVGKQITLHPQASTHSSKPTNIRKAYNIFDRSNFVEVEYYLIWAKECWHGKFVELPTLRGKKLKVSDWVRMEVNEYERVKYFSSKSNVNMSEFKCRSFTKIEPLLLTVPNENNRSVMVMIPNFKKSGDTLYHPTLGDLIDSQKLLEEDGTYELTLTNSPYAGKTSNGRMTIWYIETAMKQRNSIATTTIQQHSVESPPSCSNEHNKLSTRKTIDGIVLGKVANYENEEINCYSIWVKEMYIGNRAKIYTKPGNELKAAIWVRMYLTEVEFERCFPLVPNFGTPPFECRSFAIIDAPLKTVPNDLYMSVTLTIPNFVKTEDALYHPLLGYLRDDENRLKQNGNYEINVTKKMAKTTPTGELSEWCITTVYKHIGEVTEQQVLCIGVIIRISENNRKSRYHCWLIDKHFESYIEDSKIDLFEGDFLKSTFKKNFRSWSHIKGSEVMRIRKVMDFEEHEKSIKFNIEVSKFVKGDGDKIEVEHEHFGRITDPWNKLPRNALREKSIRISVIQHRGDLISRWIVFSVNE